MEVFPSPMPSNLHISEMGGPAPGPSGFGVAHIVQGGLAHGQFPTSPPSLWEARWPQLTGSLVCILWTLKEEALQLNLRNQRDLGQS